jgi:hypothetical protein
MKSLTLAEAQAVTSKIRFDKTKAFVRQVQTKVFGIPVLTFTYESESFDVHNFYEYWNLELYFMEREATSYEWIYQDFYS